MLGKYISAGASITKRLYRLDGDSVDYSGNSKDGADTSITYIRGHYFNQAASFNGFNSRIKIGSSGEITFPNSTPFSIRLFTLNDDSYYLLASAHNESVNGGWSFTKHSTPTNRITLQRNDYPSYNSAEKTFTSAGYNGRRMHVVGVYDGTNVQVFINGVPGTALSSGSQGTDASNNNVYLGCYENNNSPSGFFTGNMDEVVIEERAWNKRYIDRDYAQSLGRLAPCVI